MQENNSNGQKQNGPASQQGGLSWSTPAAPVQTPAQKPAMQPKAVPAAPVKAPPASSRSTKYTGMVVAGVVAGILIGWGWTAFRSPTSDVTVEQGKTSTDTGTNLGVDTNTVPALGSNPSLTITSPQPAGTSVAIAKAIVSVPTWIVIYENNSGKPGNALGAALFFAEGQAGTVELLRATLPGRSYLAVKQVDNGDRKFSLKDDQLLSEGGEVQWVTFETK